MNKSAGNTSHPTASISFCTKPTAEDHPAPHNCPFATHPRVILRTRDKSLLFSGLAAADFAERAISPKRDLGAYEALWASLLLPSRIAHCCYAFLCNPLNYSANLPQTTHNAFQSPTSLLTDNPFTRQT